MLTIFPHVKACTFMFQRVFRWNAAYHIFYSCCFSFSIYQPICSIRYETILSVGTAFAPSPLHCGLRNANYIEAQRCINAERLPSTPCLLFLVTHMIKRRLYMHEILFIKVNVRNIFQLCSVSLCIAELKMQTINNHTVGKRF